MALFALLASFALLMYLGTPVAATMIGSSLVYILVRPDLSLATVATKMVAGISSSSLVSLPLFIMAGEIMNSSGVTKRLFEFPLALIGHVKGGLAHVNILASMLFAGMSGAAIADTAGLGKIEMEAMESEGYETGFSAAITAASSTIGPIIPPSNTMIIYACAAEVSVAKLFMAGMLPGILMGVVLMIYVALVAHTKGLPTRPKAGGRERLIACKEAVLPCMLPVIIIAGICTGICTATEAGAVAVIYALLLDIFYNGFDLKHLQHVMENAFTTMAQICFIVMASSLFGWAITMAQVPTVIGDFLFSLGTNKWVILLLINLMLLVMGCFLSINATILIVMPVLITLCGMYDISLIHMGVIVTLNLSIGLLTPPVGWNLYIMSGIAKISFAEMVKAVIPSLIALFVSLVIITYCEPLVMFLPNLLSVS